MLRNPAIKIVRVAGVIGAIGTLQYVRPKGHGWCLSLDAPSRQARWLLGTNGRLFAISTNEGDLFPSGLRHAAGKILEILRLAEILIDAGEANVGDAVELLQPVHHHLPDARGDDFAFPARLELALDR